MRVRLASALLIAFTTTASAQSGARAIAPACYRVELGSWSSDFPSHMPEAHQPPALVLLDTVRLSGRMSNPGFRRVAPGIAALERGSRFLPPGWKPNDAGDSVVVFWSSGFVGVTLRLARVGDAFQGTAEAVYDVIGPLPPPRAPVTLTRGACPDSLSGARAR